ncbi:peptidyl-prolyl cis-trans isomerase Pin1-like [Hordeum vulgare]|nr:peptidyl-prolyl cis-trans isomerase Pin1-like [Hordeum vulgare]
MGRASYIRIKHEEERREASWDWKKPKGQVFYATKDTDVAMRLVELHNQILIGNASFADLVAAPPFQLEENKIKDIFSSVWIQ